MRQAKAKSLRQEVARELSRRKISWKNIYYRTTKRLYNETPRTERKDFVYNLMK